MGSVAAHRGGVTALSCGSDVIVSAGEDLRLCVWTQSLRPLRSCMLESLVFDGYIHSLQHTDPPIGNQPVVAITAHCAGKMRCGMADGTIIEVVDIVRESTATVLSCGSTRSSTAIALHPSLPIMAMSCAARTSKTRWISTRRLPPDNPCCLANICLPVTPPMYRFGWVAQLVHVMNVC